MCRSAQLVFSVLALAVIGARAEAQSLAGRLGSPLQNAPSPAPAPAPPPAQPAPDELPDWSREAAPSRTAQAPAPRFRASSGAPPDLVLTRDGGMIRGTIVRSEPGRRVVIELSTGDVQELEWGDIRFAGRAEEAPLDRRHADTPRPEPAREGELRVRFVSDLRLTLHRLGATAMSTASSGFVTVRGRSELYERVCTAPCELTLDPGVHQFALAVGARPPFAAGALDITHAGTLRGVHVNHAGARAAGGIVFALGLIGAAVMVPLSFVFGWWGPNLPLLIGGSVSGGVGLLVGIPLMALRSGVVLRFE